MPTPRILQAGIDPAVVDFSPWPGQDAEGLRTRLTSAEADPRTRGTGHPGLRRGRDRLGAAYIP